MSAISIQPTFPIFTDIDGQPLENGYIWIGTENLDPQTNPIAVYWDVNLTIAAPQPIRTIGGYPSNSGTPGRLYVNTDYSIRVQNRNGSTVYSAPQATERINGELVSYTPGANSLLAPGPLTISQAFDSLSDRDFGSARVGFLQGDGLVGAQGAIPRSVLEKERDIISVKDFGAIGDNGYRPLSTVTSLGGENTTGWSLAQWQTIYPHVVSLSQTLDWAAIQAALNYASRGPYTRESIFIPDGYYVITTSLQVPNFASIIGQSTAGTIINNQNIAMTEVGQLVNKDPDNFIFVTIKNLILRGGTCGIDIDVTGETAGCVFENVSMDLHTDFNVRVNRLLQTSKWINCTFSDADYGLIVASFTSNLNDFINCEFLNHSWSSVYLRISEVNNFIGCRFEGGGIQGRATIDLTDSRNFNLIGCYFEATHEIAVGETDSCNSIWIDGCHFTGATREGQPGFWPYQFNSDGIIQFGNNNWGVVNSNGPAKMFSSGMNWSGKYEGSGVTLPQLGNTSINTFYTAYSKQKKSITSKWIPAPSSLSRDLLRFRKPNYSGASSNLKAMTGKLTIHYYGLTSGGFEQSFSREYLIFVRTSGFSTMGAVVTLGSNSTVGAATMTVQQKAGATSENLYLEAVFTGIDPTTDIGSLFQWSFEYMHGSVIETDYIECDIV